MSHLPGQNLCDVGLVTEGSLERLCGMRLVYPWAIIWRCQPIERNISMPWAVSKGYSAYCLSTFNTLACFRPCLHLSPAFQQSGTYPTTGMHTMRTVQRYYTLAGVPVRSWLRKDKNSPWQWPVSWLAAVPSDPTRLSAAACPAVASGKSHPPSWPQSHPVSCMHATQGSGNNKAMTCYAIILTICA